MLSIYNEIELPLAGLSLIACIILFLLLKQLPLNGFVVLIYCLNVSMTVRTASYFFKPIPDYGQGLYLLIDLPSDLAAGCWTNIISITLLRMVSTLKTVNIRKELPIYVVFIFSLTVPLAICELVNYGLSDDRLDQPYRIIYYLRFAVIGVNIVCYGLSLFLALRLKNRVALKELSERQAEAIQAIVYRMQVYPLAQVIMRAGPIWHGFNSQTLDSEAANYCNAITSPLCGFGYLLVFLYVQPLVREKFFEGVQDGWNYVTCNLCVCALKKKAESTASRDNRAPSGETRISNSRYITNNQLLDIIESDCEYDNSFSTSRTSVISDRYSVTEKERERARSVRINSITVNPMKAQGRPSEIEIT